MRPRTASFWNDFDKWCLGVEQSATSLTLSKARLYCLRDRSCTPSTRPAVTMNAERKMGRFEGTHQQQAENCKICDAQLVIQPQRSWVAGGSAEDGR